MIETRYVNTLFSGKRFAALRNLTLLATLMLALAPRADGQAPAAAGPQRSTRAELAALAASAEANISAGNLKGGKLTEERTRLAAIKERLEKGDFQVGDRFLVTLRHDAVQVDTASVRDSLLVTIFALPDFSVAGVLRSELDEKLNSHVSTYLRNATVRANVLTRIAIFGAVLSPGFYYASPDRPLTDILPLAGGLRAEAKVSEVEVFRGKTKLLSGKASKRVLESGATLEQLDIQSGDEVRVPAKRQRISFAQALQLLFIFSTLLFSLLQFLQWYYNRQDG